MKKIVLSLGIIVLLLFQAVAIGSIQTDVLIDPKPSLVDEVDQAQEIPDQDLFLPIGGVVPIPGVQINFSIAQSFIPTKEIISKVDLLLARNSTTYLPLRVTIHTDLYGPPLTGVEVSAFDVPIETFGWIEFDFPNVPLIVGQTYYILASTWNVSDNFFGWAATANGSAYEYGCAWMSIDDGKTWGNFSNELGVNDALSSLNMMNKSPVDYEPLEVQQLSGKSQENFTWDTCFRTYGYNEPPIISVIKPLNGIYLANEFFIDFSQIVIIGVIRMELDAFDQTGVDYVDFYINDIYAGNSTESPYYYLWNERAFFKQFVRFEVFDVLGEKSIFEFELWKFF